MSPARSSQPYKHQPSWPPPLDHLQEHHEQLPSRNATGQERTQQTTRREQPEQAGTAPAGRGSLSEHVGVRIASYGAGQGLSEDLGHISCDGLLHRGPGRPLRGDGRRRRSSGRAAGRPRWVEALFPHAAPSQWSGSASGSARRWGGSRGRTCRRRRLWRRRCPAGGSPVLPRCATRPVPKCCRLLQGGQVESVWLPVQRRREAMALVLSACLVEGVLGVQPGTASWAAERSGHAQVGAPRARTRQPGSRIPRHRSAGSGP